jgi:hypothetical protein
MRIHSDLDPDPEPQFTDINTCRWTVDFVIQKKNKEGNRSKNITTKVGTKAFLNGRKPGLFINFSQFPRFWIRIRNPDTPTRI